MTTQIAIRLDDDEVAALDAEVTEGRAANRSDAVRRSIERLKREQRYRKEEAVLLELARRGEAVYPDLEGITDITWPDRDWPTEVTRELRAD
jgi:Arc/MetJ-type ribon-helix-helix transcriptional regulator